MSTADLPARDEQPLGLIEIFSLVKDVFTPISVVSGFKAFLLAENSKASDVAPFYEEHKVFGYCCGFMAELLPV